MAEVPSLEVVLNHHRELEEISCQQAMCRGGCTAVHRRYTGRETVEVVVAGHRFAADVVPGTSIWEVLNA